LTVSLRTTAFKQTFSEKEQDMKASSIALLIAVAVMTSACATKETKTEAPPPVSTSTPPADQPIASAQPADCQPTKNTKSSGKGKKASKPAAADCPAPAKTTPAPVAAAPAAEAPAAKSAKPSEAGKPRMMKSRDGTFEGEVYGNIPAGSKWSRLIIGMEQPEVERILGGTSHDIRVMPTAKAFIPFYFGTDRHRYEVVYRGQGSVSYTGGSWGGGRGVLMMINYDPNI
jgi:hypothetical protein